jgi:uncharacterized protein (DUF305 family)
MRMYIAILSLTALLVACSAGERTDNVNHAGHNMNTTAASNSSTVDHNAMGHGSAGEHADMASSPGAASAPYELQFLDSMIVHHKGAVDMAMLAEKRSQRKEVKELAASIIYDQEKEIGKMSEWRDLWFAEKAKAVNMEFPGMSHDAGGMELKKLESLTGQEFDAEFVRQMISHHEGAVEMAKNVQKRDARKELKELAGDIIASQEPEIKQMKEWLAKWQQQ